MKHLGPLFHRLDQRRNHEGEMRFLQPQSQVAQALSAAKSKFGSLPNLLRRNPKTPSTGSRQSPEPPDGLHAEDSLSRSLSLSRPTFEENLQSQCFSEASRQLIGREECLFGSDQQDCQDEEAEAGLRRDYEALLTGVWQTVRKALQPLDQSEQGALKEAVLAIQQEEEQDRRWEEPDTERRPDWRPRRCRHAHDSLLEEMVSERVRGAEPHSRGLSSIERELIGLGQRIRADLLLVVRQVRSCYPGDAGVCQAYAHLYHQAFSARLRDLAQYGLDTQDCTHLLSWTNHFYPSILQDPELLSEVNAELLEPLLPSDVLEPLVEQHLEDKETELRRCLRNVLEREELGWKGQTTPEMIDSCHFSPLAIDVIQCVDANLKSVQIVLGGDETHRHRMVATLAHFFSSYKDILDKVMKHNGTHSRSVVMANLTCLRLFREFLTGDVPCPEDVRTCCVSVVTSMRDSCHTHLTSIIHQNLKETYRKLWSPSWLKSSSSVCEQLRDRLRPHLQDLRALDPTCRQELLGVLHEEVLVEYVRRMMKRKIKMKHKQQQEEAAAALCDDGQKIHTLFTDAGCRVEWLGRVLPLLSELLRIQDPDTILLELVTLTRELPDVSVGHISALLQLKSGLSEKDCKKIKKNFTELTGAQITHTHTHTPARLFFSKVKL